MSPLRNEVIPSCVQGVSQQPAILRLLSQCAEQINGYPSVAKGLLKRPPTEHLCKCKSYTANDYSATTTQEATASLPQISQIDLTASVTDGDVVRVTIDGINYDYTIPVGGPPTTVATGLVNVITAAGTFNGTPTDPAYAGTLVLTGATDNETFTADADHLPVARVPVESAFTHIINRDSTERYAVIVTDGDLQVFDLLTGTEKTVTFTDGKTYLDVGTASEDFAAVTIGDYTFLVNKTVTVAQASTTSSTRQTEAMVWVRQFNYAETFKIVLNGIEYKHDTWHKAEGQKPAKWPNTYARDSTEFVAVDLYNQLTGGGALNSDLEVSGTYSTDVTNLFTVERIGSVIYIQAKADETAIDSGTHTGGTHATRLTDSGASWPIDGLVGGRVKNTTDGSSAIITDNRATTITVAALTGGTDNQWENGDSYEIEATGTLTLSTEDSLSNEGISAIMGTVQSLDDLPQKAKDGFVVTVEGSQETEWDDFYLTFDDTGGATNEGRWTETLKGGEKTSLDASTMPHLLIRNGDGTFTFKQADDGTTAWASRQIGDVTTTCPFPSFVGETIGDIFFYANRLGVVAGEYVVLSQSDNHYNWFRQTAQQLLDDDVIDITTTSQEVVKLRHAILVEDGVLVFSEQAQFVLARQDNQPLTPSTAILKEASHYDSSVAVKPLRHKSYVYFASDRNSVTNVYEFANDIDREAFFADNLTAHVPSYLQGSPRQLAGCPNEDLLAVLTDDAYNTVYMCNYHWQGNQRAQLAWHKWTLAGDDRILAIGFLESEMVLVVNRWDGLYIDRVYLEPGRTDTYDDYLNYLDRRITDAGLVSAVYDGITDRTTFTLPYGLRVSEDGTLEIHTRNTPTDTPGTQLSLTRTGATTYYASGDYSSAALWIGIQYTLSYTLSALYFRSQSETGAQEALVSGVTRLKSMSIKYEAVGYIAVTVTYDTGKSYTYTQSVSSGDKQGVLKFLISGDPEKVTIAVTNNNILGCSLLGADFEGLYENRASRV